MNTAHPSDHAGIQVSGEIDEVPPLPEDATPDQKDEHWYRHVYQGDRMPQLTWRAVVMGGFLGMIMSAANLYTTLSIGWAFGIAITACVLSFVVWNFVRLTSGNSVSQMSVLENACMASTASAAGYSTGSTIATMFGALVLLQNVPEGKSLADIKTWDVTPPWVVVAFTLCTGLMGVFLAIPMKRQMINHERLPFPTGTAAAETLRSLYSKSAEAVRKAYVLVAGLCLGLLIGFLRAPDDVLERVGFLKKVFTKLPFRIPAEVEMHFFDRLYSRGFHPQGFAFEPSALLIAAGMIVGMRISLSLLLSSLLLYGVIGPRLAPADDAVMGGPAMAVVDAVRGVQGHIYSPEEAADAAVLAAAAATTANDLDAAAVRATAQAAANGALEAALKENLSDDDARDAIVAAVAGPASRKAAELAAEKPGRLAAAEARVQAITDGRTPIEADEIAEQAFRTNRYKPQFAWSWSSGVVTTWRSWALWAGTSIMVFASLASVALQWRTIARAFTGVRGGAGHGRADIEVPGTWMIMGMIPITIAMVWLQIQAFGVSWWAGLIAVGMSFVLSLVASRATGETDTTPIGAMGKVMQLLFAGLAPGNIHANLASAGIAANSASSSADLLTDLKTGYLLGANPRKQFLAQFFGVFFGTVAIVPIWYLMVPTREKLESFALPATRAWEAVARVLVKGVGELPETAVWAILIGAGVGIGLPVIERLLPPKARAYMPSATGVGLAWVMPFQNAFSFFVGAVIVTLWTRLSKRTADQYNVPLASGLIAGESLMLAGLAIIATIVGLMGAAP